MPGSLLRGTVASLIVIVGGWLTAAESPARLDRSSDLLVLCCEDLAFPETYSGWFDPDTMPARIRELDGTRVRIHGLIIPPSAETMRAFLLLADSREASDFFRRNDIHAQVGVKLKTPFYFTTEPVAVEGIFRVKVHVREGELRLLYLVEEAEVRRCPPREGTFHWRMFGC